MGRRLALFSQFFQTGIYFWFFFIFKYKNEKSAKMKGSMAPEEPKILSMPEAQQLQPQHFPPESSPPHQPRPLWWTHRPWPYAVLVNSDILTANYSIKQSQLTKLTSEPRARNSEESNEVFDARLENSYCSITVANYLLIIVIKFVAKNHTYLWKDFVN